MEFWEECTTSGCEWHFLLDAAQSMMIGTFCMIIMATVGVVCWAIIVAVTDIRERRGQEPVHELIYSADGWYKKGITFPSNISVSSNGKTEASKTSYAGSIPATGAKPQT